jgi:hypothetical protein
MNHSFIGQLTFFKWLVIDYEISAETHIYILGGIGWEGDYSPKASVIVIPFDAHEYEYVPPNNFEGIDAKCKDVTIPSPYQTLPNMPNVRAFGHACRLDDYIYVVGGYCEEEDNDGVQLVFRTMKRYHIPSQTWSPTLKLLQHLQRDNRHAWAYHGLAIIPFVNHNPISASDPLSASSTATINKSMDSNNNNSRDCLMTIGGGSSNPQCDRYDPLTNKWSSLSSWWSMVQWFGLVHGSHNLNVFQTNNDSSVTQLVNH